MTSEDESRSSSNGGSSSKGKRIRIVYIIMSNSLGSSVLEETILDWSSENKNRLRHPLGKVAMIGNIIAVLLNKCNHLSCTALL